MPEPMIRIYIVEDDHAVILPGLKNRFRPSRDGIDFIGSAPSVSKAIAWADPESFDLFFLDLFIPDSDPIENITRLKKAFPGKPIIIYSTTDSAEWKSRTSSAGARAYLSKKDEKDRMRSVIMMVRNGEIIKQPSIASKEIKTKIENYTQPLEKLSPLQHKIISLIAQGDKLREIATATGLSKDQVEKILGSMREHYGAKNNPNLVSILMKNSLM